MWLKKFRIQQLVTGKSVYPSKLLRPYMLNPDFIK